MHATPLRWLLIACASLIGALGMLVMPATSQGEAGITWTSQTSAANNTWTSVTYGNGLFVAVASAGPGSGNRVMTSPNGIAWTIRTSAVDNFWSSVTYGNGLFVAVAWSGTNNRVMTSPDGITWTHRASAADNGWRSVTYGNGLFVAVASTGPGSALRVMTSPNGITWTSRRAPVNNAWLSVTYGNGLFVAVSLDGTLYRVMTSPDGITWTHRTAAVNNDWLSVTYGNGLFVAVATSGSDNRVMTSPDGITWTSRTSAANNTWTSVTYGDGLFVAVSLDGTNRVMTSGTLIPPTPATPTATAGNAEATITVAQGSGPGGTPDFFTVTAVGDNTKTCTVTGASGSCTITGLTNGTSYTFTATAANTKGTSAPSGVSAAVTPTAETLTLSAKRRALVYGGQVRLTGTLSNQKVGESVDVLAKACGQTKVTKVATVQTTTGGAYIAVVKPLKNTVYTVRAKNTSSPAVTVKVAPRLRLGKVAPRRYSLRVFAARSFAGKYGTFQRYNATLGRWVTVKRVLLRANSTGIAPTVISSVSFPSTIPARLRVRVILPQLQVGSCYLPGRSNVIIN